VPLSSCQPTSSEVSGQGVKVFEAAAGIKQHHTLFTVNPALLD
jgi:hypothetical protein